MAADTTLNWDNSQIFVPAGTILDVEPGSALEAAYGGPGNLPSLYGTPLGDDQQGDDLETVGN